MNEKKTLASMLTKNKSNKALWWASRVRKNRRRNTMANNSRKNNR